MQKKNKVNPSSTFLQDCENRRILVGNMRKMHPDYTLQQIGEQFGISRERVRQILNLLGIETKSSDRLLIGKFCERCGTATISKKKTYCKQCQYELHHVPLICDNCGTLFWRLASGVLKYSGRENNYNHSFCNRSCFWNWMRTKPVA